MHKTLIAEEILVLFAPRERAASMAGDLTEEADTHGTAWFARALAGVCIALFLRAFGDAKARTLALLGLGLVVWAGLYAAARVAGAWLGIEPAVAEVTHLRGMPAGTLVYLGGTLALSNLLAGVALGWVAPRAGGLSPAVPLAMFWSAAAVAAPCLDAAAGSATTYCTLIYLAGIPMLYVAPLLAGGALAGPGPRRPAGAGR